MRFDTVIIGAGLTGLKHAISMYKQGKEDVLITDYEKEIGGFLQAGIKQSLSEAEILREAQSLPYTFWLESTVINLELINSDFVLTIQQTDGKKHVKAKEVIICTGAMEKTRGANRIPGTRPAGEMPPYLALQIIKQGYLPGYNPLIITNNDASCAVAKQLETYPGCHVNQKLEDEIEIVDIKGKSRVEGVVVLDKETNEEKTITCDSFIFSSGKVPNTSFLKNSNVLLDKNKFICTDKNGQTNLSGLYAIGDCAVQP